MDRANWTQWVLKNKQTNKQRGYKVEWVRVDLGGVGGGVNVIKVRHVMVTKNEQNHFLKNIVLIKETNKISSRNNIKTWLR